MNIVPARIQEQVSRVDRTRALVIGISAGLAALWAIYRLFWLLYSATALSSFGLSTASLFFSFVLWGVIGVVAGWCRSRSCSGTPRKPEADGDHYQGPRSSAAPFAMDRRR